MQSVGILTLVNVVSMVASMLGAVLALPASSARELSSSIAALLQVHHLLMLSGVLHPGHILRIMLD